MNNRSVKRVKATNAFQTTSHKSNGVRIRVQPLLEWEEGYLTEFIEKALYEMTVKARFRKSWSGSIHNDFWELCF